MFERFLCLFYALVTNSHSFPKYHPWPSGTFVNVVQSCSHVRLCDLMDCSTPGFPVLHQLLELAQTQLVMSIQLVMLSNHLILCPPLLLLPSVFPGIRVFSNESALRILAKVLELCLQHQSPQ